jgi:hypothetical protein
MHSTARQRRHTRRSTIAAMRRVAQAAACQRGDHPDDMIVTTDDGRVVCVECGWSS